MEGLVKIKRALVSVSSKEGILPLCWELQGIGVEIVSTGGTARFLKENGVAVTEVSQVTSFPEVMEGRVKTLHPHIHAAILARRDRDLETLRRLGIEPIDLVVVNLYPFERTVAGGAPLEEAIEQIDIGGPAMIRAAAKNYRWVTVVVDPEDYPLLLEALKEEGGVPMELRERFALKAFRQTACYDAAISRYLASLWEQEPLPERFPLGLNRWRELRYGENPHQRAALYLEGPEPERGTVAGAELLQGKPLSYNNLVDADTAWACVASFSEPACVIVKHANPCGVSISEDPLSAYLRAYQADPVSAFGGVIAFNREVDGKTASAILEKQFVEVVLAPSFSEEARQLFSQKKNLRLLALPLEGEAKGEIEFKRISGGILVQEQDQLLWDEEKLKVVTRRHPTEEEWRDLRFAWKVVKFVKSNSVVYARAGQTVGIGAGQTSRVDAARIGIWKAEQAGLSVKGAVMASEAFFPFRDSVDKAARAGVTAVIQPGGSIRDPEVIAAADEHGLAMVFTGIRHFRH